MTRKHWFVCLSAAIRVSGTVIVLSGCGTTHPAVIQQKHVGSQRQAGAVLTSITRAIPWDDVVDDLKAEFEMTPAIALQKGVVVSQRETAQDVNSLSGAFEVQVPGSNFSKSETVTIPSSGKPTVEQKSSQSLASSDRDKLVPSPAVAVADKLKALEPLVGSDRKSVV